MLEHAGVHRGSDEERATRRERGHREEVVGEPVRELREDVRGGGRDDEEVRSVGEADVQDVRLLAPEIRGGGPPREGLERERRDEAGRGGRQDRVHARAGLRQQARELGGLVRGDGAADAEEDSLAAEDGDGAHSAAGVHFVDEAQAVERQPRSHDVDDTSSLSRPSRRGRRSRSVFIEGPSSFRNRSTIPSTRLT